jgi:hypothetical protein
LIAASIIRECGFSSSLAGRGRPLCVKEKGAWDVQHTEKLQAATVPIQRN